MSFETAGAGALDDMPCRYGASKLLVRGPRRSLSEPYIAFLGSSDTYGKFVEQPFAALTETAVGIPCINLGCVNAGVDAFLNDPDIAAIASGARLTVLQVLGAQNISNRFYRVHTRRNDRFLQASSLLSTIYREVDFTEFHFNKHMLSTLYDLSPERFEAVREELRTAWVNRMRRLMQRLESKTLLLWLRYSDGTPAGGGTALGPNPLMVTRSMLRELRSETCGIIEIPVSPARQTGDLNGMKFGPLQAPVAEQSIGPTCHAEIAGELIKTMPSLL